LGSERKTKEPKVQFEGSRRKKSKNPRIDCTRQLREIIQLDYGMEKYLQADGGTQTLVLRGGGRPREKKGTRTTVQVQP